VPDWDLLARLPDVELADLARPIDRPLKRPGRRREQRPNLNQVVVDDRLARGAAQRLSPLALLVLHDVLAVKASYAGSAAP